MWALAAFSGGLAAWETPHGACLPVDALHLLHSFLLANKVHADLNASTRPPPPCLYPG